MIVMVFRPVGDPGAPELVLVLRGLAPDVTPQVASDTVRRMCKTVWGATSDFTVMVYDDAGRHVWADDVYPEDGA